LELSPSPELFPFSLRPRPFSGPTPLGEIESFPDGGPPLLGFLLPRTQLRRVPLIVAEPAARAVSTGEGCHTPTGAVLRVLAPLDGSGFLPARGTHGSLARPAVSVAPGASRPYSMPLASLELPYRAFPSRRAVPALAGLLLPCGYRLRFTAGAVVTGTFTVAFAAAPTLCPPKPPGGGGGRRSRDSGSSRSLGQPPRHARERACSNCPSRRHWARRVSDRHARFEALLPSGVRSRFGSVAPARAEPASRCSPGLLLL